MSIRNLTSEVHPWFPAVRLLKQQALFDRKHHMCLKSCLELDHGQSQTITASVTQFLLPLLPDRTFASAELYLG